MARGGGSTSEAHTFWLAWRWSWLEVSLAFFWLLPCLGCAAVCIHGEAALRVSMCACVLVCLCVRACMCEQVCVHVCVCACVCVRMCVWLVRARRVVYEQVFLEGCTHAQGLFTSKSFLRGAHTPKGCLRASLS